MENFTQTVMCLNLTNANELRISLTSFCISRIYIWKTSYSQQSFNFAQSIIAIFVVSIVKMEKFHIFFYGAIFFLYIVRVLIQNFWKDSICYQIIIYLFTTLYCRFRTKSMQLCNQRTESRCFSWMFFKMVLPLKILKRRVKLYILQNLLDLVLPRLFLAASQKKNN